MKIINLNPDFDPAGVGWTLTDLINRYTEHECTHMVTNIHYYNYPTHVHLKESKLPYSELAKLFNDADVIHINQAYPFVSYHGHNLFGAVNRNWSKVILEFHGAPELDLSLHGYVFEYLKKKCPIIFVHPHYLKFIPGGIVPEIITPVDTENWVPEWREKKPPYKLGKSSSSRAAKNRPEFEELCQMEGVEGYEIHEVPHKECLRIKRDILDIGHDSYDLGYVNISAFENACFGVPTFSSGKSEMELYKNRDSSGGLPFENVENNEQAAEIIRAWIKDPDLLNERSREIRAWMEKFWNGRDCARIWTEIYEEVL